MSAEKSPAGKRVDEAKDHLDDIWDNWAKLEERLAAVDALREAIMALEKEENPAG
jgi:isoaspartyl peptidase/L-asparaginase-like protein (Ntn-hydrolase superfamily)